MQLPHSIINSDIIKTSEDTFWNELPDGVTAGAEIQLLVISKPITAGGTEEVQLQKMMQACGLDAKQYYHLQVAEPIAWHKLRDTLKPTAILLLGIHPKELGISALFHLYAPNNFDGCIWIPSIALNELEQQPEAKKQLWLHGLKPIFVDKTTSNK
jgi:hypothetical protein